MKSISSDDMQNIALGAGTLILENGGETYRAEETVVRVGNAPSDETGNKSSQDCFSERLEQTS